ncbi:MAG: serine protease [Proteobacteria bacterium]|nr:serine protease [Pseudomonadota bacterium]
MFSTLKTLRDAAMSASIILVLFGTPVGAAAIKNVPMMQDLVEAPATETRTVYLPSPAPEAPALAAETEEVAVEEVQEQKAPKGGNGLQIAGIEGARGLAIARRVGRADGDRKLTAAKAAAKKRHARRGRICTPDNPMIELRADGSRVVDRGLVDTYAGDIKALNRLGWISKHKPEGRKSDGILVRGIRCGNDLHELGIRNNDVVHAVNGKPVRNLVGAIALYFRLKGKDDFEVELTRGGKRVVLAYRLT